MIPPHLIDHTYSHPSQDQLIVIDQQYADDKLEKETPLRLKTKSTDKWNKDRGIRYRKKGRWIMEEMQGYRMPERHQRRH